MVEPSAQHTKFKSSIGHAFFQIEKFIKKLYIYIYIYKKSEIKTIQTSVTAVQETCQMKICQDKMWFMFQAVEQLLNLCRLMNLKADRKVIKRTLSGRKQ